VTTLTPLLDRLERTYDGIPRVGGARAEPVGPFELFLREGPGWPYYARPRLGTTDVTVDDVQAVLARQREHGVPEAIEWVDDVVPALLPAVRESGLQVHIVPLMVLDPAALPEVAALTDAEVFLLDPDSDDFSDMFALSSAVAGVAFGVGGTSVGTPGPLERDEILTKPDPAQSAYIADGIRNGTKAESVAIVPVDGMVARGARQSALGVAEIVGVATLPSARRRGLGAAVSAIIARQALDSGHDVVFLSAASEAVARVYARIGFRRVGTACIAERS
jgi:ribosomal protein S18 acetylase RimI-like enzyme